jgi:hypothetical protein
LIWIQPAALVGFSFCPLGFCANGHLQGPKNVSQKWPGVLHEGVSVRPATVGWLIAEQPAITQASKPIRPNRNMLHLAKRV